VDKAFLEECLMEGLSLEAIGKRVGKHESTVSYWLKKHGLAAVGSETYAPNQKVDPDRLRALVKAGASIQERGEEFGAGRSTIRIGSVSSNSKRSARFDFVNHERHARKACGVPTFGVRSTGILLSTHAPKVGFAVDVVARKRFRNGGNPSRRRLLKRQEAGAFCVASTSIPPPCRPIMSILRKRNFILLRVE
jgi:hypothetical protein